MIWNGKILTQNVYAHNYTSWHASHSDCHKVSESKLISENEHVVFWHGGLEERANGVNAVNHPASLQLPSLCRHGSQEMNIKTELIILSGLPTPRSKMLNGAVRVFERIKSDFCFKWVDELCFALGRTFTVDWVSNIKNRSKKIERVKSGHTTRNDPSFRLCQSRLRHRLKLWQLSVLLSVHERKGSWHWLWCNQLWQRRKMGRPAVAAWSVMIMSVFFLCVFCFFWGGGGGQIEKKKGSQG